MSHVLIIKQFQICLYDGNSHVRLIWPPCGWNLLPSPGITENISSLLHGSPHRPRCDKDGRFLTRWQYTFLFSPFYFCLIIFPLLPLFIFLNLMQEIFRNKQVIHRRLIGCWVLEGVEGERACLTGLSVGEDKGHMSPPHHTNPPQPFFLLLKWMQAHVHVTMSAGKNCTC